MNRIVLAATAALGFVTFGCAVPRPPQYQTYAGTMPVNMMPKDPPPISTGYGFDMLGDVQGKGCVERGTHTFYATMVGGVSYAEGASLESQATQAAIFNAISSAAPDADTMIVTRLVTEGTADKACSTVWGRAIRLRAASADRPTPPPPPPPPPAAPVAPATPGCTTNAECKGGRVCVQGNCAAK